ncbi:MAG: hypothetical protein ABIZ92_15625 [Vicinamibacterales bacterium]
MLPLFTGLLAFAAFPVLPLLGNNSGYRPIDENQPARAFGLIAGISGLLVTMCAAPAYSWVRRRGPVTLWKAVFAGMLIGNLPCAAFVAFLIPFTVGHIADGTMAQHYVPPSQLLLAAVRMIVIGSGLGAASAAAFWFAGIYGSDAAGT